MSKPHYLQIRLDDATAAVFDLLAQMEQRSESNLGARLITEALIARGLVKPLTPLSEIKTGHARHRTKPR